MYVGKFIRVALAPRHLNHERLVMLVFSDLQDRQIDIFYFCNIKHVQHVYGYNRKQFNTSIILHGSRSLPATPVIYIIREESPIFAPQRLRF